MNRSLLILAISLAAVLACSGCLGPLDTLGNETLISETEHISKDQQPEDDRIEDKHPQYVEGRDVREQFPGCTVTMNKSASVTLLDIKPFPSEESQIQDTLFADRLQASLAVDDLKGSHLIPSMEVVDGLMKPFNDGLYGSVEVAVQDGLTDSLQSKREFLYELLAAVLASLTPQSTPAQQEYLESAAVFVAAALLVGGNTVSLPADLLSRAQTEADLFLARGLLARPVGFYAWNNTLEEVFRQDRFLQNQGTDNSLEQFGRFAALAAVFASQPDLLNRYQPLLALYRGLTNPLAAYTPVELMAYCDDFSVLDDLASAKALFDSENPEPATCAHGWYALLPASVSRDTSFYNSRWCENGIPAGVSFIDEFISAIRDGEVDLSPGTDSGWYDYQLWALETLLLPERGPESDHLLLTADYKQKLIDTFKSIITQNRETHVKQLDRGGDLGSAEELRVFVYPLFRVEPFPTFYLRSARAYRFLRTYLQGVLGPNALSELNRLDEDGQQGSLSLLQELDDLTLRLYGFYFMSAQSVGLDPQEYLLADELAELDMTEALAASQEWLSGWKGDPDVARDPRVIVPVASDGLSQETIYWATLGVKALKIHAEFVPDYEPEIIFGDGCKVIGFDSHEYVLLVEHMEEVRISSSAPPPTRAEFRAMCDEHQTVEAIVAALEAL